VVRETPWNLIQARNIVTVMEAGASVLPAMPSFYSNPKTFEELADTVVFRVLDQLGINLSEAYRWGDINQE
jgi:4-hydroxy-3-polyprenylbenzoate decarboxylase